MKKFFNLLRKDTVLQTSFWITLFIWLVTIGIILVMYRNLPPFLPLYNHLPWGYARLGHAYELFIPSGVIFVVSIINISIGVKLLEKYPLLARFLFLSMLSISAFVAVFVVRLIFLVI